MSEECNKNMSISSATRLNGFKYLQHKKNQASVYNKKLEPTKYDLKYGAIHSSISLKINL